MKNTTKTTIAAAITASFIMAAPVSSFAEELPMVEGKITQVMKDKGKVTINHGPITNLDMDGMTMIFNMKDAKQLDNLKKGDKVMFTVIDESGKLVITTIKKGK